MTSADQIVERARLFALLDQGAAGPLTLVCGPAGSGKSMLVSSWLERGGLPAGAAVAWVDVERDAPDAGRFWSLVVAALRDSGAVADGDPLATLVPAPLGAPHELVERLAEGLERLAAPVVLVLDDLHQLRSDEAMAGLERLLARAPVQLHTVVISRRDPQLGLHRLRLAGRLTEIRAADLDFTAQESAELLAAAGVAVGDDQLAALHERTEGWAAALRLAAMSLARHDAPERFVAEFSGSERTVADYLLGEVLASRPPAVRRLLLRTCVLDRVSGPLAELLTGCDDASRLLHELEEANALVVAVDVGRTWFRYHHLLADLLRLELRREAPGEVAELHRLAAAWYAEQGHVVEAIHHAQLGEDWAPAAELLGRHWVRLILDGEEARLSALLDAMPESVVAADAELAAILAGDRLRESRWTEANALLAAAERALPDMPPAGRRRADTALATVQLLRARRLGDMDATVARAACLLGGADDEHAEPADAEREALALLNLGIAETWTWRLGDAVEHLERGLLLGRRLRRPYLEIGCLATLGAIANMSQQLDRAEELLTEALTIADRVGWAAHPLAGVAAMTLGAIAVERGRNDEGETLLLQAAPLLNQGPEPAAAVAQRHSDAMLAYADGRYADAYDAWRDGERLADELRAPHFLAAAQRQWQLRSLLRLGDDGPARAALAEAEAAGDEGAHWRNLAAHLRLRDGDPEGAAEAVAPTVAGTAPAYHANLRIEGHLLHAVARLRAGDAEGARVGVEEALALAGPQGRVWIVLSVPGVEEVLRAHPAHATAHGAHLRLLLDHLAGDGPAKVVGLHVLPDLSDRELAVLRFLPTNLSATEIGSELYLSVHTVKTHMRKLYAKLDVHRRAEAVDAGRALGLLGPQRRAA